MEMVCLDDTDFDEIEGLFTQFHSGYVTFFETTTRNVAKPALDYLQGQLFTKQRMNLTQFCREVPDNVGGNLASLL
jgi:hypothetical protein